MPQLLRGDEEQRLKQLRLSQFSENDLREELDSRSESFWDRVFCGVIGVLALIERTTRD